ncbi:MAG: metallophosphoesterase, partial [Clostridia bacterium]|nr:metallophosphoesterase [Clostridia bacterium]
MEKAKSITLPDNGVLRVLQLTDLHLTAIPWSKQDRQTVKWVKEAVKFARADVVALTGDAVGSLFSFRMRDKALIEIAEIFEEAQVYWMYTFGNHDGEWAYATGKEVELANKDQGKEELYELLKGYKYSLMRKGDTDGIGNYVIDVVDGDGNVVYGLVNMDSQGKNFGDDGKKLSTYQGVTVDQTLWYEREIKALNDRAGKEVKTSLFMHVPLYEYVDAWLNNKHVGDFPAINIEARCNEPDQNIGFYDKIKELNSTDFVTVGHDHDFNWLIKYGEDKENGFEGVYFSYGRVSGVNAWERRAPLGATIIDININAESIDARYKV